MGKNSATPKRQSNTLLNYFSKSPGNQKPISEQSSKDETPTKKLKNDKDAESNRKKNNSPQASTSSGLSSNSSQNSTQNGFEAKDCRFQIYDIVWAKLEGYPWWPAIVCLHPTEFSIVKKKGKIAYLHVQFFEEQPTRSWISLKNVKEYKGKTTSNVPILKNPQWNQGVEFADEALKLERSARASLITALLPSDDENTAQDYDDYALPFLPDKEEKVKQIVESQKSKTEKRARSETPKSDKKRKRLYDESPESNQDSDASDEYKPEKEESSSEESMEEVVENLNAEVDSDFIVEDDDESDDKMVVSKKNESKKSISSKLNNGNQNSVLSKSTLSKLTAFNASTSSPSVDDLSISRHDWPHLKYDFLQPNSIRDLYKRRPDDPEYDNTTLFIPKHHLGKQTPCHKQWWEFKSKNFDALLLFKMGKFYELFHMDAVIAVNELHINFMKGEIAHAGFPEKAYKDKADVLIQRGYKVIRIEQTETPQMMDQRIKKCSKTVSKDDKVVRREICQVTTKGTRVCSVLDAETSSDHNHFLMAICENTSEIDIGVCFVDTTVGTFYIGRFLDDKYFTKTRTLLATYAPVEILLERKSTEFQQTIAKCLPSFCRKEYVKKFDSPQNVLKMLREDNYFEKNCPPLLEKLGLNAVDCNEDKKLALKAFGALVMYLKRCLIDEQLLTCNRFEEYIPTCDIKSQNKSTVMPQFMVLDEMTLKNLDIFLNSQQSREGTLLQEVDFCQTQFGKRLLHKWISTPSCQITVIENRLNSVEELNKADFASVIENARKTMKSLPDLERILTKFHTLSSIHYTKDHPNARAVLFDINIYNKRKINDFLSAINGFKQTLSIVEMLNRCTFESSLLRNCCCVKNDYSNGFPDIEKDIEKIELAFDHKVAKHEGKIIPKNDDDYNEVVEKEKRKLQDFDNYLNKQKSYFGNSKVAYFGTGKNRFQLEIPDAVSKKIDNSYELQSHRKGFSRYYTKELKRLISKLNEIEKEKDVLLQDSMRRLFEKFDILRDKWIAAINRIATLDVLFSFAQIVKSLQNKGFEVCRPQFDLSSPTPYIKLETSSHPCLIKYCENFIPNDVYIENKLVLLTGPNMGGKSTLMRQIGLITILAHMGSYVPASSCSMTLVDRIFTRLGATDRIMEGESTFFVELQETANILQHSTKHSLVLLDELGRGTGTHDGCAIAYSVVKDIKNRCRCLFSTHYHSLVEEFSRDEHVQIGHMACKVENENEEDPTQETITFLYKFKNGPGNAKSYGFNAAKLSCLPSEIVRRASQKAKDYETFYSAKEIFYKSLNVNDTIQAREMFQCLAGLELFKK